MGRSLTLAVFPSLDLRAWGALCALASAAAWALIGLAARALAPYLNALSVNLFRSAGAAVLLGGVVVTSGRAGHLAHLSPGAWASLAGSVVVAFAVGDTAFFEATRRWGLGRALTVSMAYPLLAALLGLLWLGEPLTLRLVTASLVTLGGLALIVGGDADARPSAERRAGLRLAVGAAAAWAVSAALMKPPLAEVDPLTVQAVRLPLATFVLGVTPWARGATRRVRAHPRQVLPLLLALSFLTALSAVTFVAGLKYAGLALGTVLSSTAPLFGLPLAALGLGERLTGRAALGAGLAVAGIALLGM